MRSKGLGFGWPFPYLGFLLPLLHLGIIFMLTYIIGAGNEGTCMDGNEDHNIGVDGNDAAKIDEGEHVAREDLHLHPSLFSGMGP